MTINKVSAAAAVAVAVALFAAAPTSAFLPPSAVSRFARGGEAGSYEYYGAAQQGSRRASAGASALQMVAQPPVKPQKVVFLLAFS